MAPSGAGVTPGGLSTAPTIPAAEAGGPSVWSKLGQYLQKGTSSSDDLFKPIGNMMNQLDMLGLNKPLSRPAPLRSSLQLDQPAVPQLDPNAQRLAIMQAFNMQG